MKKLLLLLLTFSLAGIAYGLDIKPSALDVSVSEPLLKNTTGFTKAEITEMQDIRSGAELQITRRTLDGKSYILRQTYFNKQLNKYVDEYYYYKLTESGKELSVTETRYQVRSATKTAEPVEDLAVETQGEVPAGPSGHTSLPFALLGGLAAIIGFVIAFIKRLQGKKEKES